MLFIINESLKKYFLLEMLYLVLGLCIQKQ